MVVKLEEEEEEGTCEELEVKEVEETGNEAPFAPALLGSVEEGSGQQA